MKERTGASDDFKTAYAGAIDLPLKLDINKTDKDTLPLHQAELRTLLADRLYGPVPPPPAQIKVTRQPIAGEPAERLLINISVADRQFEVDAALWLPAASDTPAPLICGLDFIGPIGLMHSTAFPIDPQARISSRPDYGARDNRIEETLRGVSAYRWPVSLLCNAGYAVLVSCYGSWVPDDNHAWKSHGLYPLLDCQHQPAVGAISLWTWAIQRLLDAAAGCAEIDESRSIVAGHSRLGKTALWAAANDARISAVFANNSGCGGSAPAAHPVGETLQQMAERFPHWTIQHLDGQHLNGQPPDSPHLDEQSLNTANNSLPFDQHDLLSLIAPRAVYLAGAKADLWSDPLGSYLALQAATPAWHSDGKADADWPTPEALWQTGGQVQVGSLGYHLRPGGHDLLPYDWRLFLAFLNSL